MAYGILLGQGHLKSESIVEQTVAEKVLPDIFLDKLCVCHVHLGTSADSPCNNGFLDDVLLDGLNDTVFFDVTNFSKYEYLTFRVSFIAEEVMWSQSPLIAIPS